VGLLDPSAAVKVAGKVRHLASAHAAWDGEPLHKLHDAVVKGRSRFGATRGAW